MVQPVQGFLTGITLPQVDFTLLQVRPDGRFSSCWPAFSFPIEAPGWPCGDTAARRQRKYGIEITADVRIYTAMMTDARGPGGEVMTGTPRA